MLAIPLDSVKNSTTLSLFNCGAKKLVTIYDEWEFEMVPLYEEENAVTSTEHFKWGSSLAKALFSSALNVVGSIDVNDADEPFFYVDQLIEMVARSQFSKTDIAVWNKSFMELFPTTSDGLQIPDLKSESCWRLYLLSFVSDPNVDEATRRKVTRKFEEHSIIIAEPGINIITNLDLYSFYRGMASVTNFPLCDSDEDDEDSLVDPIKHLQQFMKEVSEDFAYLLADTLQTLFQPVVRFTLQGPVQMLQVCYATNPDTLIYMGPRSTHFTAFMNGSADEEGNSSLETETVDLVYTQHGNVLKSSFAFNTVYSTRSILAHERVVKSTHNSNGATASSEITPFNSPEVRAKFVRLKELTLYGKVTRNENLVRNEIDQLQASIKALHQSPCLNNMHLLVGAAQGLELYLLELKDLLEFEDVKDYLLCNAK